MNWFLRVSAAFVAACLTWLATMGGGWWLVQKDRAIGHGSLDRFSAGALFFAVFALLVTFAIAGVKRPAALGRWILVAIGVTALVLVLARAYPGKMPIPLRTLVITAYDLGFISLGCLGGMAFFRYMRSYLNGAPIQSV